MKPNWSQLVEFTAEFYPAPWLALPSVDTGGHDVPIRVSISDGGGDLCIWVSHSIGGRYVCGDRGEVWEDEVQEATARLVADAPVLLIKLAELVDYCNYADRGKLDHISHFERIVEQCEQVIRRHVRIGCAPVDAESRATPPVYDVGSDVGQFRPHSGE